MGLKLRRSLTAWIWPRQPAGLALAVGLAALALYLATLAPGLLWGGGDFAAYQTWAYLGRVETPVGVFGHVLWVIAAHPFTRLPIGDVAWRANLAAAVFAAASLVFVFLSARRLTRSRAAPLLATGALAVSHTFWTYAVMPKVYSLNALFLAVCTCLLLRWRERGRDRYLCLFALLYGLSFLNHLVMATAGAGYLAFIAITLWPRRRSRAAWRSLLAAGALFGLGVAPYVCLLLQAGTARATGGVAAGFFAGLAYALTHPAALLQGLGWGALLGAYQFPIAALAGLAGFGLLWRADRAVAALVGLGVLGTVAFLVGAVDPGAGNVYVWNLHYYLQAYLLFALALAAGLDALWRRWGDNRLRLAVAVCTLVAPVILYAVAPAVARAFWTNVPDFRPLPGRDNLTYVLSPWKQNETGAREFGERILRALPPGGTLLADYSIWAVVHYLQVVERQRPDVTLVRLPGAEEQVPFILAYRSTPDLFLADTYRYYDVEGIQEHFDLVAAGPIFRLVPREAFWSQYLSNSEVLGDAEGAEEQRIAEGGHSFPAAMTAPAAPAPAPSPSAAGRCR